MSFVIRSKITIFLQGRCQILSLPNLYKHTRFGEKPVSAVSIWLQRFDGCFGLWQMKLKGHFQAFSFGLHIVEIHYKLRGLYDSNRNKSYVILFAKNTICQLVSLGPNGHFGLELKGFSAAFAVSKGLNTQWGHQDQNLQQKQQRWALQLTTQFVVFTSLCSALSPSLTALCCFTVALHILKICRN